MKEKKKCKKEIKEDEREKNAMIKQSIISFSIRTQL